MTELERPRTDDEALSALIDGVLTPSEAAELAKRLAADPALAARLADFERGNAAVQAAYRDVVDEPLPENVVSLLRGDERSRGNVIALGEAQRRAQPPRQAARFAAWPAALAAGIALAVGIVIGLYAARESGTSAEGMVAGVGPIQPATALHDVLERDESGRGREVARGVTATPRLSFAAAGDTYCRELEIAGGAGTTFALACRRSGSWRIEVAEFAPRSGADGGVYRPAAGSQSAVEQAVDTLIVGEPLEVAEERSAIARGWRVE